MEYIAKVNNSGDVNKIVGDTIAAHSSRNEHYYRNPKGFFGFGFNNLDIIELGETNFNDKHHNEITFLKSNFSKDAHFMGWLTCGHNLSGFVTEGENVYIVLCGRRHGLETDIAKETHSISKVIHYRSQRSEWFPWECALDHPISPWQHLEEQMLPKRNFWATV